MGVQLIVQIGLQIAQMAITASRRIEGPRVDDLKVTSGDYGAPWPRIWGMRWLRPPLIWAQDLKEVKQTRKTKGGKFNDYTYFGSWAHGLAIHPIDAVRRIKADGHLVYDASGTGPVTPFVLTSGGGGKGGGAASTGGTISDYMTFYPGSFTQDIDPAIEADVDGRLGAGSTPAYRGRSLLVFKDLPLEKFGNRIPQIEIELVAAASPNYPWESRATINPSLSHLSGAAFSSDFSRFMWADPSGFEIWDVAARARMISGSFAVTLQGQDMAGLYNSGKFLMTGGTLGDKVYQFEPDGSGGAVIWTAGGASEWLGGLRVVADSTGGEHWIGLTWSSNTTFVLDGVVLNFAGLTGLSFAGVRGAFRDAEGSVWLCGSRAVSAGTQALFYRLIAAAGATGPGQVTVSGLPPAPSVLQAVSALHTTAGGSNQFVFNWGTSGVYAADRLTGAVLHSNSLAALDPYNIDAQINLAPAGSSSLWLGPRELSLADLSTLRTVNFASWSGAPAASGAVVYDPVNHALITSAGTGTDITWRYLDRVGSAGVVLGDVVRDVAVLAGINPAQIDASALNQLVPGFNVTSGSGKDWLEPLLDLYDVDARPHGFLLEFIKRGTAPDETILSGNFAMSDGQSALFSTSGETGATDLPRQVTMQFADVAIEQQPNLAASPPLFDGDGQRVQTIDMSNLALPADVARQLVARYARRQRFDARGYSLTLPLSRIDLEPGAVKTLDLAGVQVIARLQSMVLDANRRIALEWKGDDPSVAVLDGSVGAPADGYSPPAIAVPLLSRGFMLDVPLLSDIDEHASPVVYALAAAYAPGTWPGAAMLRLQSGEYSDEVASIEAANAASWGTLAAALPDANPNLWDRLSSVSVVLQVGTLSGCTPADLDADPSRNLARIGQELVQFTTATLTAPLTYTLSGFKRGRRGTEWACGIHGAGETFVLLNHALAVTRPLSEVGTTQLYKAVTHGRTEAGTFPIELAPYAGASKKPYAPCRLMAVQDAASGDWALRWVRRTRIGGAWTGGTPIPLGEVSEAYAVEIMNGAVIKRTISGLSAPITTYTAAQQVADWGSTQSVISWRVYQISDAVGRGFAGVS